MAEKKTIIWDWNGTLLDDMHICIDSMNILLGERSLPPLDAQRYRDIFTFPVRDYYVSAGFDFSREAFEEPAVEFIEHYDSLVRDASLFHDAREALHTFHEQDHQQMILSAMQQDFLEELVQQQGIRPYFSRVCGIDDHYAGGKTHNARELIARLDGDEGEIVMIGDTVHDHEVGLELGIRVILVTRGHQSAERLKKTGREIAADLGEVVNIVNL
jgi:phosphoglycolate phosphatase